jgi:hypothetical protein
MKGLQYNTATLINSKKTNAIFVNNGILVNTIPPTFWYEYVQVLPLDKFLQTAWPSGELKLVSPVLSNLSCSLMHLPVDILN